MAFGDWFLGIGGWLLANTKCCKTSQIPNTKSQPPASQKLKAKKLKKKNLTLKRLRFCNFKLRTMLNITKAISRNLPTEELLRTFEILLIKELNIGKVLLFAYNKKWELIIKNGIEKDIYNKIDVEDDLLIFKDFEMTIGIKNKKFQPFDVIIPVFHNNKVLAYILIGDIDEDDEGTSASVRNLQFIQTLTSVIIVAIENKRLIEKQIRQERIKKELETATKIQQSLIPEKDSFPKNKKIKIETFYMPHFEIGGDYFDFEEISKNEVFFCIADVSGKGISAALLMSNFQANIKASLRNNKSLKKLTHDLNNIIVQNSKGEHFITLFMAKYHYFTKILTFVNAGHNSPILYDKSTKKISLLKSGCVGIGMLDNIPSIKLGRVRIKNDSKLICYTDGLSELAINGIEDYGLDITKNNIANNKSIGETIYSIKKELNIKKGNPYIFDDITILGIEFKNIGFGF